MMDSWSLDIKDMPWVEGTVKEVDFLVKALDLRGGERILDLACGFGRHALELARRGYSVVGVDITPAYIADARHAAQQEHLAIEFHEADVREVLYHEEFDVVLNMADGAIGYFATEEENLKLFDVIGSALRAGGKHVMGICSAAHARKHFPKRYWEAGDHSLSLVDLRWQADTSRMIDRGYVLRYGEVLEPLTNDFLDDGGDRVRLYTLEELEEILRQRGLRILAAYGAYDTSIPASDDQLMQVICSQKEASGAL